MPNSLLFSGKDWSKLLFWGIVLSYIRLYVPYGINETDGGFLTAHAWRLCQGDLLYQETIYVRPPLPILLRYLELVLLPDNWALFAERIFFYLKVALYSYLGASILYRGNRLWYIASLAFIISVHSYPAAAWHTIDGILFSVGALYCLFKNKSVLLASGLVIAALLCKQSFYPLLPLYLLLVFLIKDKKESIRAILALAVGAGIFLVGLYYFGIQSAFFFWTSNSAGLEAAFQHGFRDYWSINPLLLGWSLLLLLLVWQHSYRKYIWYLFLSGLLASFVYTIYRHQEFSVPASQSRLLFLLSLLYLTVRAIRGGWNTLSEKQRLEKQHFILSYGSLLAISWMASVSWGYSFPILFALPWIALADVFTRELEWGTSSMGRGVLRTLLLLSLLFVFRYSYEFIYRDARRSEMRYDMSTVFPKLKGIWSDRATFDKYTELKELQQKYGSVFKTLPAFPLSNYLTGTSSPLPLDWIIDVESNGREEMLLQKADSKEIIYFIEKEYAGSLKDNPRYAFTDFVMKHFNRIEETDYFYVYEKNRNNYIGN